MEHKKAAFEYKWIILGACFLMIFVCLGFCSTNSGLYLNAITKALGIKRSLFSVKDTFRFATSAISSLFFGSLVHRFGIRKMVAFVFFSMVGSMLLHAYATNIFGFYVAGALMGLALSFISNTMASSIIRRWFKKGIGRYTGIVFSANGIGSALAVQIASPIINRESDAFGYRDSYLLVAGILLIVGIAVVALLRERPAEDAVSATKTETKKSRGTIWCGIHLNDAKHQFYFYFAAVSVFLTGLMLQGIQSIYVAHFEDVGLSITFVATVASVFSLLLTFTKIGVGVLYDRVGLRIVMIVCQIAATVAFVVLGVLNASEIGMVLAVLFVILHSFALPMETLMVPLIVNDLFGTVSYDKIIGIFIAVNYTGYSLGSPIINFCYDAFGSYKPVLLIYGILMVTNCIMLQWAITAANNRRREIVEASTI